jgi:single-strand DNA-binding protein
MAGEPEITIVGSLGRDPELRFTPGGKAVASFSVAVSSRKKSQSGGWEDDGTTWYRCTAWDQMAENVTESLVQGSRVIVQGRLRMREFDLKDGGKGKSLEMQVSAVGPELRWATAKVVRLQREASDQSAGAWAGSDDAPPF